MAQLVYGTAMEPGFPGMKADSGDDYVRSYAQAEATLEIPFGCFVAQGATATSAKLPTAAGDQLVGVLIHAHTYGRLDLGDVGLKPKATMGVMSRGVVWVKVEEAVLVGDRAFVRHTASGLNTQLGGVRKSADTATAVEAKGCRFLSAASAGGVAQLEVDMNVVRATQA